MRQCGEFPTMCNTRFQERVKRIEARHLGGARAELVAGINETRAATTATAAALPAPRGPHASLMLILLGAATGLLAARHVLATDWIGLARAMSPEIAAEFLRTQPVPSAAATFLSICALFALASLLRGRRAVRMMSFSVAALGAVFGTAIAPML